VALNVRFFGWVTGNGKSAVVHRVGMPEDARGQTTLPPAALLIIDEADDGALLLRYAATRQFAGDTWHPSVDAAKAQAKFEFGDIMWHDGGEAESLAVNEFAAARLRERSPESN
jgi:hypothetical protein